MRRQLKKCIMLFVMLFLIFIFKDESIFAGEDEEQTVKVYLYQMYGYSSQDDIDISKAADLYNCFGDVKEFELYVYRVNSMKTGYVIYRIEDGTIVESSQTNIIPYNYKLDENIKFIYGYYLYGIMLDNGVIAFRDNENYSKYFDLNINYSITRLSLPSADMEIYLQGSKNCIACAMAHALVYYKNNGYSSICSVTGQTSFNNLMDKMESYLNDVGGYANNNIAGAFARYCNYELNFSCNVIANGTWNPQYSQVSEAITAGKPVMVGFAPAADGSSYSKVFGHMTLCVGTATLVVETNYLELIDGHSASIVTRIWNSTINDYINIISIY